MTMQRVQDQDNGISIKFGPGKPRKGNYRLVSQSSDNKGGFNGTNKLGERVGACGVWPMVI